MVSAYPGVFFHHRQKQTRRKSSSCMVTEVIRRAPFTGVNSRIMRKGVGMLAQTIHETSLKDTSENENLRSDSKVK